MRAVDHYPRVQVPPSRRSEDPGGLDFSHQRYFQAGRTAVLEPIAPEPTAESVKTLRSQAIGADMFRYDVEIEDEQGRHRKLILTHEGDRSVPVPEPLGELLSAVEEYR